MDNKARIIRHVVNICVTAGTNVDIHIKASVKSAYTHTYKREIGMTAHINVIMRGYALGATQRPADALQKSCTGKIKDILMEFIRGVAKRMSDCI